MNTDEKSKALLVNDLSVNETSGPRTHVIVVGGQEIEVKFELGKQTILPFEQGAKFMGKEGFVVREVDGNELKIPAVPSDSVAAQIGPDECVAKYDELTFNALKVRAAQKQDGEIFLEAEQEDRDSVIAFLIGDDLVPVVDEEEDLIDLDPIGAEERSERVRALIEKFGALRWVNTHPGVDKPFEEIIIQLYAGEAGDQLIIEGTIAELELMEAGSEPREKETNDDQDANQVDTPPQDAKPSDEEEEKEEEVATDPEDLDGDGVNDRLAERMETLLKFFNGTDFRAVDTEENGATIFEIQTEEEGQENVRGTLAGLEEIMAQANVETSETE